jgi:hypothetical protein
VDAQVNALNVLCQVSFFLYHYTHNAISTSWGLFFSRLCLIQDRRTLVRLIQLSIVIKWMRYFLLGLLSHVHRLSISWPHSCLHWKSGYIHHQFSL